MHLRSEKNLSLIKIYKALVSFLSPLSLLAKPRRFQVYKIVNIIMRVAVTSACERLRVHWDFCINSHRAISLTLGQSILNESQVSVRTIEMSINPTTEERTRNHVQS